MSETLESQIERLATYLLSTGHAPQDEGAVDMAIRLMQEHLPPGPLKEADDAARKRAQEILANC